MYNSTGDSKCKIGEHDRLQCKTALSKVSLFISLWCTNLLWKAKDWIRVSLWYQLNEYALVKLSTCRIIHANVRTQVVCVYNNDIEYIIIVSYINLIEFTLV